MNNPRRSQKPRSNENVPSASASQQNDRALIQSVLNGDKVAYRKFERRYRGLIYTILRRCHVCEQDQEDLYQEVYVRLWACDHRCLRRWQATSMSQFGRYLGTIVRNLVCDWYRGSATTLLTRNHDDLSSNTDLARLLGIGCYAAEISGDFDASLFRQERASAVLKAIGALRPRDVDLVTRKYFEEQSYQEMAQALGITVDHVGVALANARKRLRHHLCRLQPHLFTQFAPHRHSFPKACSDDLPR